MIVYSAPVDLDTFERQRREYLQANPNTRWPRLTAPETEIAELLAALDNMGGGTVATGQALRGPPGFAGRLMGVELVVGGEATVWSDAHMGYCSQPGCPPAISLLAALPAERVEGVGGFTDPESGLWIPCITEGTGAGPTLVPAEYLQPIGAGQRRGEQMRRRGEQLLALAGLTARVDAEDGKGRPVDSVELFLASAPRGDQLAAGTSRADRRNLAQRLRAYADEVDAVGCLDEEDIRRVAKLELVTPARPRAPVVVLDARAEARLTDDPVADLFATIADAQDDIGAAVNTIRRAAQIGTDLLVDIVELGCRRMRNLVAPPALRVDDEAPRSAASLPLSPPLLLAVLTSLGCARQSEIEGMLKRRGLVPAADYTALGAAGDLRTQLWLLLERGLVKTGEYAGEPLWVLTEAGEIRARAVRQALLRLAALAALPGELVCECVVDAEGSAPTLATGCGALTFEWPTLRRLEPVGPDCAPVPALAGRVAQVRRQVDGRDLVFVLTL